ncbi:probable phosphoglycerate mutase [Pseudomonas pohangensis]|uniref:Probable phosphoglycerate mutase n=1 Tax=Pseudomonas pohangensis TaxID=364197 RepID=A0A1H2GNI5_9PSED|nr:histidine phosphatase family protein [Pseudomonas pohangensis]SDU21263.1 probable phosphoglycerate mutase [Pseudomonas pohangensis]
MTTLILVRHGEVPGIEPPTFRGQTDLALTGRGHLQARASGDFIRAHWHLDAIYSSSLSRCIDTARALAGASGPEIIPQPGLLDIDYGDWTTLAVADVQARWPREAELWKSLPQQCLIPGGESLQDVAARVTRSLALLLNAHPDGTVAVVTHDSVLRVMLCHVIGIPLSAYWSFEMSPCGVSVLEYDGKHFFIHALNQTGHLPDALPAGARTHRK